MPKCTCLIGIRGLCSALPDLCTTCGADDLAAFSWTVEERFLAGCERPLKDFLGSIALPVLGSLLSLLCGADVIPPHSLPHAAEHAGNLVKFMSIIGDASQRPYKQRLCVNGERP